MLHLIKYYSHAADRSRTGLWWRAPYSTVGRHWSYTWRQGGHMSLAEMALRVVPRRIVHERLAEEHLDLVVRPALRREGLQVHDDPLDRSQCRVSRV